MSAARKAREPSPPEQLAALVARLKQEGLAPAYVLRGDERYFRERALDELRAAAQAGGLEARMHDGNDPDFALSRLLDDLGGGGLFSSAQLVVARNVEKELEKIGKDVSPLTRAIAGYVAQRRPGSLVISAALRVDHAVVKAVQAAGGVVLSSRKLWDTPSLWGNPDPRRVELVLWLVARARDFGVRLSPENAVYVAAATGNDLFALEDQIKKLRDAPQGAALGRVVGWDAAGSPWAASDALLENDLGSALSRLEALFRGGFEERDGRRTVDAAGLATILLGALVANVRRSLAIAAGVASGRSAEEAAREAGVSGAPVIVERAIARARAHPPAAWRARLEDLAQLELKAKSGGVEADDCVLLALRWLGGARTARPRRPAGRAR